MTTRHSFTLVLLIPLSFVGCKADAEKQDSATDSGQGDGGADGATGGDGGGEEGVEEGGFPASPSPFTIQTSGAADLSLSFSEPGCAYRTGATSFRETWRGEGHVFVLILDITRDFAAEPGSFGPDQVRVRLQEEAGGSAAYFDSGMGSASATAIIEGFDTELGQAWGSVSPGTLGDSTGASLTISPLQVPIWCSSLI